MMTNLLCGLVERKVHCQTNRGQELKIQKRCNLPSLCTNLCFTREPKEKVVIDCESRKRLVHIYEVNLVKQKLWYGWLIRVINLVIVYQGFVCTVYLVVE